MTIWFSEEGIEKWLEEEEKDKKPGRQKEYGDEAIKTMYIIRQVFNLRLRQTEGFVKSILTIMKLALPVPDYTTLARRARELKIDFVVNKPKESINLILSYGKSSNSKRWKIFLAAVSSPSGSSLS